jgi:CO/xanthine dehydrogenase Mo-binding subunit
VAEELGVKLDAIQIENADTGTTQYATSSGGSKTVPTESPAVRGACISVKQQLLQMAAEDLKTDVSGLFMKEGEVRSNADASKRIKISDISGLKKQGVLVGIGYRAPNPVDKITNPFAAQFCEVEVNMKTGEVKILRFVGANESGRVMDRLTYDNQVFGGITMGIGLAMMEARILDAGQTGKMLNRNWHDYKIPTALDVPAEMVSVPLDLPDPEANTAGAKGLGEPVTIPTAPAVANAIYHATGVRVTRTAMTPVHLCELFARAKTEKKREG